MSAHADRRRERTSPASAGTVRLHIDRLVMRGVARGDIGRLVGALEAELTDLAAQPGAQFRPIATMGLPAARIAAGRMPEETGRAIGGALWSGIAEAGGAGAGQGEPSQ
ncbi:MAG TPA: hypothetical protein VET89_14440 [Stellaceae bacterium]|nr:hypothetical protein [Stellaceae bacterium]